MSGWRSGREEERRSERRRKQTVTCDSEGVCVCVASRIVALFSPEVHPA